MGSLESTSQRQYSPSAIRIIDHVSVNSPRLFHSSVKATQTKASLRESSHSIKPACTVLYWSFSVLNQYNHIKIHQSLRLLGIRTIQSNILWYKPPWSLGTERISVEYKVLINVMQEVFSLLSTCWTWPALTALKYRACWGTYSILLTSTSSAIC